MDSVKKVINGIEVIVSFEFIKHSLQDAVIIGEKGFKRVTIEDTTSIAELKFHGLKLKIIILEDLESIKFAERVLQDDALIEQIKSWLKG